MHGIDTLRLFTSVVARGAHRCPTVSSDRGRGSSSIQELRPLVHEQFLPHVYLKRPLRNRKNVEQVTSAWSDPLLLAFRQSSPSPYPLLAARNNELAP
jgi:hypothetical protein